jgi:phage major head subunit gpT-like protein
MDAKSQELVDLGAAPMPTRSDEAGGLTIKDHIEKNITVSPVSWDITVWISQDSIDDDQTGTLDRKVRGAGDNFNKHLNQLVFATLNGGDGTTYGLCYDGQEFFDSDHVDKGAHYQTNQDNEYALALTPDNFETVWVAAQSTRDDQGEFTEFIYDLLVCHPTNKRTAANITGNADQMDTANREMNPFAGEVGYITTPEIDSTAWYLIASNENVKPIIVAMRKAPALSDAWFDPEQPDGGYYFFKFRARYYCYYGDWRLAYQGQT